MKVQKRWFWLLAVLLLLWRMGRPSSQAAAVTAQQRTGRLVIQESELEIMVTDTDTAVTSALDLAVTFDAYVLKQRVWDGEDRRYRYANITFGLEVDDFEGLMQAFKTLGTVLNETASGQDVTDQRLDLNSQLSNLYETQARMRGFLEQARNITETLQVHQELVKIENEIGEVQGQVNFLTDRAEAATIRLRLVPFIPTPTPSPTATPTPTPTPTPLPTPQVWRPGDTAQVAAVQLQDTAQTLADVAIYRSIVCGPWLLLFAIIGYFAWQLVRRRRAVEFLPHERDESQ